MWPALALSLGMLSLEASAVAPGDAPAPLRTMVPGTVAVESSRRAAAPQIIPSPTPQVVAPSELIRRALEAARSDLEARDLWQLAVPFYEWRGHTPAWTTLARRAPAMALLARMQDADRDGLPVERYRTRAWARRLESASRLGDADRYALDVALSAVFVQFLRDLALGLDDAGASARNVDIPRILAGVDSPATARQAVRALEPPHGQYHELRRTLSRYRALAAQGGWTRVPDGPLIEPAAYGEETTAPGARVDAPEDPTRVPRLEALCRRLAATGDLAADAGSSCGAYGAGVRPYDARLDQAVRRFQRRHGLLVDGIVGPRTLAALNEPIRSKLRRLAINLNRWRRQPDDLGAEHVFVNIPGYRLHVVERGRPVLSMRVVAGKPSSPTPAMRDAISYLVFRPYWNVPASIAADEMLPKIAQDRAHLQRRRLEIVDGWRPPVRVIDPTSIDWDSVAADVTAFPYRIRQRPGPHNALGLVKFMFPNDEHVYLHDTPATHLFDAPRRAFSHGCVRVEQPAALAAHLLRHDPSWSRHAVGTAMRAGPRQMVPLETTVPVHLAYFTAWAEEETVHFWHDVYGMDGRDVGRRHFADLNGG